MYLVNDVIDREKDRLHFSKRNRPIALGNLPIRPALFVALLLIAVSLTASLYLSNYLFFALLAYLAIQLLYTLLLKNVIILDVLAIAFAFMLRIFAGSVVVLAPLSAWLILTTMMLALFLGIGKRRSEVTLLSGIAASHRKTLLSYPVQLLDGLAFMMATATLITYSLFTFVAPETIQRAFFASFFPRTLASPKMLMLTIPVVVYGIFRYLYLIFEKSEGESPEKVFLTDKPLFAAAILWLGLVIFLLYFFSI
jgi:4-hydroxybenzoate polyprenyltransferase